MHEGMWASMAAVWQGSLQKRVILQAALVSFSRFGNGGGKVGLTVAENRRWRVAVPARTGLV